MTANSSTCVPMPTPRLARSPLERSNTVTSQPAGRSRSPANNPPSEPPMISARAMAGQPVLVGQDRAMPFFGRSERLEPVARGHGGPPGENTRRHYSIADRRWSTVGRSIHRGYTFADNQGVGQ